MSLQGSGNAFGSGKYLSTSMSAPTLPCSRSYWLLDTSPSTHWTGNFIIDGLFNSSGTSVLWDFIVFSTPNIILAGQLTNTVDLTSAGGFFAYTISPSNSTWIHIAWTSGTMTSNTTVSKLWVNGSSVSPSSNTGYSSGSFTPNTFGVDIPIADISGNASGIPSTTLLGSLCHWTGSLSDADAAKLYNGGAGGLGQNPKDLTSTSTAVLANYYFDKGVNTLNDQKGSADLTAQGGYSATFSSTNPPINTSGTVASARLLTSPTYFFVG